MRTAPLVFLIFGAFLGGGGWTPTHAQEDARPPRHNQIVSANPLLLTIDWFNAEYERRLADVTTAGLGGGWVSLDDKEYSYVHGFFRYYPQVAAFRGFYVGGAIGVFNVKKENKDPEPDIGFGIDIGHNWLLGFERTFHVGIGVGASRLLRGVFVPRVHLVNIGITF